MSDLISREALLEAIGNTWEEASPLSIINIIANAPAVTPQSVADALEEAAKLVSSYPMLHRLDSAQLAKEIRALIKRNTVKEGE